MATKFNQKLGRILCFCLFLVGGTQLFAQTFTVTNREGDNSVELDKTVVVRFFVELSAGSPSLGNVVPRLDPPDCGVINVGGQLLQVFSTSYAGYRSGSNIVSEAIPSWGGGTTQEIAFFIHTYNDGNDGSGDNAFLCDDACFDGGIQFDLAFQYERNGSQFTTFAGEQAGNNYLALSKPLSNVLNLLELFQGSTAPRGLVGADAVGWPMEVFPVTQSLLDNPSTRIFLMMDWRLGPVALNCGCINPNQFFNFNTKISPGNATNSCAFKIDDKLRNGELIPIEGIVNDLADGSCDSPVPISSFGGAGGDLELCAGINLFDITDFAPTCSGRTLKQAMVYDPNENYNALIQVNTGLGFPAMRGMRIYLGQYADCVATQEAFNLPSSDFRFVRLDIESNGRVSAQVDLPWKNGANLASGYTIEWFVKSFNTFRKLTDLDGGDLTLEASISNIDTIGPIEVEARVRHIQTNSRVSVTGAHDFNYSSLNFFYKFDEDELFNSEYVDPGEQIEARYTISNRTGETLTGNGGNIFIDMGVAYSDGSLPAPVVRERFDFYLNGSDVNTPFQLQPGESVEGRAQFELQDVRFVCKNARFYVTTRYTHNGYTTSYKRYFDRFLNCDDSRESFGINQSNWTFRRYVVNCQGALCSLTPCNSNCGDGDWSYETNSRGQQGWVGRPATPGTYANPQNLVYALESSTLNAVGKDLRVTLEHFPSLPLNVAGGVLEYSLNGSSTWQDLVVPIETTPGNGSVGFYSDLAFPSSSNSYLQGKRVWMNNFFGDNSTRSFNNQILSDGVVPEGSNLKFRFLFQAPFLYARDDFSNVFWELYGFYFSAVYLRPDNIYGVQYNSGDRMQFEISPGLEVGVSLSRADRYTFEWYTSLAELSARTPDEVDEQDGIVSGATWDTFSPPNTSVTYYLRILKHDSNGVVQDVRIVPLFFIAETMTAPGLSNLLGSWFSKVSCSILENDCPDKNGDGFVDIRDFRLFINDAR